MGLLSLLFGCNTNEVINPQKSKYYVYGKETNKVVYYKYYGGGNLSPRYDKLHTNHPQDLVVLSEQYATDGHLVFHKANSIEKVNPKGFIVNPEFSASFAKDTISKTHYYRDVVLNLDFSSAKIHSRHYVSDKNKVLFNEEHTSSEGFDTEIPVQDIPSFELINKNSRTSATLAKDMFWFYLNAIQVPIPSNKTQIIQLGNPSIFLHKDTLHCIYPNYEDINRIRKNVLVNFKVIEDGIIGKYKYDTYHHYKIIGFANASQVEDSHWLKDDNGLYYIDFLDKILEVSKNQYTSYEFNSEFQNYLRTESNLFGMYYNHSRAYSNKAKIVTDKVVIDNNNVHNEGKQIENSDIATFIKFDKYDFIDKNYYYYGFNPHKWRQHLPHWAYEELKSGKLKENDLSNIKMEYTQTTYIKYWNGFLVTMKVPSKHSPDNLVSIEFKNIERKTLNLNTPLEETVFLFFTKNHDDTFNSSIKLNTQDVYNYKEVEDGKTITFTVESPKDITKKNGVSYTYPYFITLSSTKQPDSENYDELYIRADVKLKK